MTMIGPLKSIRLAAHVSVCVLVLSAVLSAQDDSEHRFTFNAGGGFSPLTGSVSNRLNNGWQMTVGAGYNLLKPLSLGLQYTYNGVGAWRERPALVHYLRPKTAVQHRAQSRTYLVGSVGYYRRTVDFTRPALVPSTIFDPFFGFLNGVVCGHE